MVKHRPIFVEFIGPAGAGKTSIVRTLIQSDKYIADTPKPSYRDGRDIGYLVSSIPSILPFFIPQPPNNKWLNRRQIYMMLFLNEWHHILDHHKSRNCMVSLLDHGPIYMLTSLLEFGPEITQSKHFRNWWSRKLKEWSNFLDLVVWLDAPDPILAKRIKARDSWHVVKDESGQEITTFFERYRKSFAKVISTSRDYNNTFNLLRFRTDRETLEQINIKVLSAINGYLKNG